MPSGQAENGGINGGGERGPLGSMAEGVSAYYRN